MRRDSQAEFGFYHARFAVKLLCGARRCRDGCLGCPANVRGAYLSVLYCRFCTVHAVVFMIPACGTVSAFSGTPPRDIALPPGAVPIFSGASRRTPASR